MSTAAVDHSPVAIDAGPVGVLLSHGFTGSPASMRPWARELGERGYTVRAPLLPGHGTTWQDMNTTTWRDWYAAVDDTLTELRSRCTRVVVAGLSMGGCLALRLAEQRPADVDGLVLVNPAIASRDKRLVALPLLHRFVPSLAAIGNDIKKPGVDEGAYPRTPLRALYSQTQMWKDVRQHLDDVRCPVLFLRSDDDHVVDDESLRLVRAALPADQLQVVPLSDSFHVATLDHDAPLIIERSAAFIADLVDGADRAPPDPHSPDPSDEEPENEGPDHEGPERGRPEDDFDSIVERLGLNLTFPQDPDDDPPPDDVDDEPDPPDEQFYRRVDRGPVRRPSRGRALGVLAVAAPPLLLAICTIGGIWLPRAVVLGCGLIFVAGAIYLISQLPEHGPGRPGWPDDGAEL